MDGPGAETDQSPEEGWTAVLPAADLPMGRAVRVVADRMDLFLYRTEDRLFALDNRCNHQGGPLHKGVVKPTGSMPTVTCPVHGSIFRLTDGRVVRGPAQRPQAAYEARLTGDIVEVRPAPA